MTTFRTFLKTLALAAGSALAITAVGQGLWGGLAFLNLAVSPAVPWAPVVMTGLLVGLLGLLGGWIGPRRGAAARRALLPLKPVAAAVWARSLVAGACGVAALAGLWITLGQLVPTAPNLLPDVGRYPPLTLGAFLIMGVIAAPLSEEAAFRGYAMGLLGRVMPPAAALVVVSLMFALVHLTQGLYPTKLLVYFLAGLMFGFTAWRTGSLIPAMVVHSAADLTFFTLVWPGDAHRAHVSLASAAPAFWLQAGLTLALGVLAVVAYAALARATGECAAPTRPLGAPLFRGA
jgi:membrane protease YdiL (CAAX protease family)